MKFNKLIFIFVFVALNSPLLKPGTTLGGGCTSSPSSLDSSLGGKTPGERQFDAACPEPFEECKLQEKSNNSVVIFGAGDSDNKLTTVTVCVQDEKAKTKAYKGKKIVSQYMNLLNAVLVKFPTTTLRMAMAADRGQKAVNSIINLKPIGMTESGELVYFETSEQEYEYVKKQLEAVLAPVEKFMDDIKEHRGIVKNLLEHCLGAEKTKDSFIYKSFDVEGSFLTYFSKTIKTVAELNAAATEFLIFFADINASLSEAATSAYNKLLDKISANKKAANKK